MTDEADCKAGWIESAKLDWAAAAPRSVLFDDIYFSGDGEAETEHVFIRGNDLPARFSKARSFVIGELGFGAGLNFLKSWALWRRTPKPAGARLHFFSIEGFPLDPEDMARVHAAWPALADLSARLREALAPPAPGLHHLLLDDGVSLTLGYGDAANMLAGIEGGVDAWFFDGFSPAKNPDMWRPALFEETARLSNPGATFATFTVAGAVRRALAGAGFACEKRPGFAGKREMLSGRLESAAPRKSRRAPWFETARPNRLAAGAEIGIIGGGVAGASLAFAARCAGLRAAIIEPCGLASGASGNPAGLIMPRIDLGQGAAGRFFLSAYFHTIRLLTDSRLFSCGGRRSETFNPCGVLLGANDEKERERQQRILNSELLPAGWIEERKGGLFFPQAGVVHPPAYVAALARGAELVKARAIEIRHDAAAPTVRLDTGAARRFDAVIIANGADALAFADARGLPLAAIAGQVDWFAQAPAPEYALAFGPYAAPAANVGNRGGLVIGATYEKALPGAGAKTSRAATRANIDAVAAFAPDLAAGLEARAARPRASLRCQTPDRTPVAGPLPDLSYYAGAYDGVRRGLKREYPPGEMIPGTYILSGLGSRGLVTAPLAAAMILAEITGQPAPVDYEASQALHPARFFIRNLKRAQTIRKA